MTDFNHIGRELDSILRVRTTPLGIKYFEDEKDLPEAFEKIDQQITICQLIGTARYHEKAVYTTSDLATACAPGGALQGFFDIPPDMADGTRCAGWFAKNVDATKKIFANVANCRTPKIDTCRLYSGASNSSAVIFAH